MKDFELDLKKQRPKMNIEELACEIMMYAYEHHDYGESVLFKKYAPETATNKEQAEMLEFALFELLVDSMMIDRKRFAFERKFGYASVQTDADTAEMMLQMHDVSILMNLLMQVIARGKALRKLSEMLRQESRKIIRATPPPSIIE